MEKLLLSIPGIKFIMQPMMTKSFTGFGFEFNFAFTHKVR